MKDQQTNNIDTQDVVNNKKENAGTQDEPLTTEGFHALLEANTAKLSEERTAYATAISDLQQSYDDAMDIILKKEHQANAELRKAREAFEKAKEEHELFLRQLKRERNEVGRIHNEDKAEAKNRWATANEEIQSERHDIFERYRYSGGVLSGATEGLLHPGWTRDKKGGMIDEEK